MPQSTVALALPPAPVSLTCGPKDTEASSGPQFLLRAMRWTSEGWDDLPPLDPSGALREVHIGAVEQLRAVRKTPTLIRDWDYIRFYVKSLEAIEFSCWNYSTEGSHMLRRHANPGIMVSYWSDFCLSRNTILTKFPTFPYRLVIGSPPDLS